MRFNETARRSDIASNWRIKENATPRGSEARLAGPRSDVHPGRVLPQSNNTDYSGTESLNVLRGEDDPTTLQAIAEGRRLYVGNMPYFAKAKDVQDLFQGGDCDMYV